MWWVEKIRRFPFISIVVPLLAGVIISINVPGLVSSGTILILLLFLFCGFSAIHFFDLLGWSGRWVIGVLVFLFMLFAGYAYTDIRTPEAQDVPYGKSDYVARVISSPEEKASSYCILCCMEAYSDSVEYHSVSGNALVYLEKDSLSAQLKPGDYFWIESEATRISNRGNPEEFDYQSYMDRKGIFYQMYASSESWRYLTATTNPGFSAWMNRLRSNLVEQYEHFGVKGDELAVVSALTLGYKDLLSDEVKQSYSYSGGMHVLAVSGLHVGIIYLVTNGLLFFLGRKPRDRFIRAFVILFVLWFYAFLTGFSPSVLRASVMFSFIVIGSSMYRETNIYNIIAASAFFLVMIDPYIVAEVGFQLSYLAVLSIVFFYPKIYNSIKIRNRLLDKAWALTAVSLSAQIGTFPISVFYFHQFPNFFLLTNFVVIPMAAVIIYEAIVLIAVSFLPFLADAIGWLLNLSAQLLNESVSYIEKLPFSVSQNLDFPLPVLLLLYILIITIAAASYRKTPRSLVPVVSVLICVFIVCIGYDYTNKKHECVCIYNVKGSSVIGYIDGENASLFLDNATLEDTTGKVDYAVKNHLLKAGVDKTEHFSLEYRDQINARGSFCSCGPLMQFGASRGAYLNGSDLIVRNPVNKIHVDFLVIGGREIADLEIIMRNFSFSTLVIDSSVARWKANDLLQEAASFGIETHDIAAAGAYLLRIS